jgi:predicted nucleic acid-binding protein
VTLIIDASVALKWFMEEPESDGARRILDGDEPLAVLDLIIVEACNGARKAIRRHLITAVQADAMAHQLPRVFEALHPAEGLAPWRCKGPATSTTRCFYLVLAEQRDARMVTPDRRLIARIRGTGWEDRVQALLLLCHKGLPISGA